MKYSKDRLFIFFKQKSSLLLFLIGITASLMALKGINQYFSALIRLTKTKLLTPVTSNTDESHGQGGSVKYIALRWNKSSLCAPIQNYFASRCGQSLPSKVYKTSFKEHQRMKSYIIWNIPIIPLVEYVHPTGLLTSKRHSLRSETDLGSGKEAWNI